MGPRADRRLLPGHDALSHPARRRFTRPKRALSNIARSSTTRSQEVFRERHALRQTRETRSGVDAVSPQGVREDRAPLAATPRRLQRLRRSVLREATRRPQKLFITMLAGASDIARELQARGQAVLEWNISNGSCFDLGDIHRWDVLRGWVEAQLVTALVVHTPPELTAAVEKNSARLAVWHHRAMILLRVAARLAPPVCQIGPSHAPWWQKVVNTDAAPEILLRAPNGARRLAFQGCPSRPVPDLSAAARPESAPRISPRGVYVGNRAVDRWIMFETAKPVQCL